MALALGLMFLAGSALAAFTLKAEGKAPVVGIQRGEKVSEYLSLEGGALQIPLAGPGQITGFAKRILPGGAAAEGLIGLSGVPGLPAEMSWSFKASSKDALVGRSEAVSGGKKIAWDVPAGTHVLKIEGDPAMLLRLRYEGPAQPFPEPEKPKAKSTKKKSTKKKGWTFKRKFGLNIKYDDNVIHYSDDLMEEYTDGPYLEWFLDEGEVPDFEPGKYRLNRLDDLILTPAIDLEARRKFFSFGETRFRAKYVYTRYLYNPIKDVKGLTLYLRQVLPGKSQSIEISYKYTPEKYIRELTDRPPYAPSDDPRPWVGFRFAQNDFVANYRHRIHKKVSITLTLEDIHRFYNQPFLEQDLVENEFIGRADYTISKMWKLTGIYGVARGWTRRHDTAEEAPLNSDDNDNSYTQDRYRVDLRWTPPKGKYFFNNITARYQLRIAYFTSPKQLWDDPFHVGRKDVYDTYRLIMSKKLTKKLSSSLTVDFSKRTLHSPYTGDISEGMDYDNFLIWMDLTYNW